MPSSDGGEEGLASAGSQPDSQGQVLNQQEQGVRLQSGSERRGCSDGHNFTLRYMLPAVLLLVEEWITPTES